MNPPTSKGFVDSHFHVFEARRGVPGARYVPAYAAPLAAWRDAAQAAGVTRGVLVQPSFLGTDNGQMIAALQAHPDLLRGVAVVAPSTPLAPLREMHTAGVRGVRLNLAGEPGRLDEWAVAYGFWDSLQALGWHLQLHTDIGALPQALARVPQAVPVVIDHMGKPHAASTQDATVAAVSSRARRSPVHIKLSGSYRLGGLDAGALARLWLGELGAESLVWGSDWPCTNHEAKADYGSLFGALHDWVGSQVATAALTLNAERLYWSD